MANANYKMHSNFRLLKCKNNNNKRQASLVVQWLRICLPMQGTQV